MERLQVLHGGSMRVRDESGQMLVVTALSLTVLMGFLAVAIDVGLMFRARRTMQIAADAAAMAGATQLFYGPASQVQSAAYAAAKINGVDHTVAGNTVRVSTPPADGPNTGCLSCVEVQVGTPNPTFFMGLITGSTSLTVAARAVAGAPSTGQACVYIMSPSAQKALQIHGSGAILMQDCGVYVNSNASNALCVTGSASKSTFPWIEVVGSQPSNGNCGGNLNQTSSIDLNSAVQSNPLGNITGPVPDANGNCSGTGTTTDKTTTLINGSYNSTGGGTVCFTKAIELASGASLGDGLYVFENGLTIDSGTVTVGTTTNGATLDVYGGTYNQSTSSSLTIYAPTSGTYNGIAVMQPASNTNDMQVSFGSSTAVFDGMIYAPGAYVTLHDEGGGGVSATGVVASTMYVNGSLNIENYSDFGNNKYTTPFRLITMIE